MKNIKDFEKFNENTKLSHYDKDIFECISFRNHSLKYWMTNKQNDILRDEGKNDDNVISEIEGLVEQFEIYHQDEYPNQIVINKENLITETLLLAKTIMQLTAEVDRGILQAYISDAIVYGEKWQLSKKLVSHNNKSGVFEN